LAPSSIPAHLCSVYFITIPYSEISPGLGKRFRGEIDDAIERIKQMPFAAGHFLNTGSTVVPEVRRCNLKVFPFFILYGVKDEMLIFASLIACRSDPLTWLTRWPASADH
jgi:hypothetical protein